MLSFALPWVCALCYIWEISPWCILFIVYCQWHLQRQHILCNSPQSTFKIPLMWHPVACGFCIWLWVLLHVCMCVIFLKGLDRDGHVEVKLWILLVVSFLVVTSLFQVWSCWVLFRVVGLLTASDAFPELLVLLKQTALTLFTIDVCFVILIL